MKLKRKVLPLRRRRQLRLRARVQGTPERPRLNIYRSLWYIYAQAIDDSSGTTLACANSQGEGFPGTGRANLGAAAEVGKRIAAAAKAAGVVKVVFDRAGYRYHGRVKALAEAARAAGLQF